MKFTLIDFTGGDIEKALIDDRDDVVMSGDYYHDKINDKIEGFFEGLDYAKLKYNVEEVEQDGSLYDSKYS